MENRFHGRSNSIRTTKRGTACFETTVVRAVGMTPDREYEQELLTPLHCGATEHTSYRTSIYTTSLSQSVENRRKRHASRETTQFPDNSLAMDHEPSNDPVDLSNRAVERRRNYKYAPDATASNSARETILPKCFYFRNVIFTLSYREVKGTTVR